MYLYKDSKDIHKESSSSVVRMDDSREADTAHRPSGLMDSDTFLTYGR